MQESDDEDYWGVIRDRTHGHFRCQCASHHMSHFFIAFQKSYFSSDTFSLYINSSDSEIHLNPEDETAIKLVSKKYRLFRGKLSNFTLVY